MSIMLAVGSTAAVVTKFTIVINGAIAANATPIAHEQSTDNVATLHNTTLCYATLHYTTLHYTTLRYTTLRYAT